ncbi:MAG: O-antigen ligase family protein, partial [Actinobacteria bacterium]|nr:O-antigen ligase family protein [Actinomycetota bacterium]
AFAAAGGPGAASRQWEAFKNPLLALPAAGQDSFQRFGAVSGNGRYQAWSTALDAAAAHPWAGIGPGTFEFWWESHGSLVAYLRNAHSLFFETAAEVGFVGLGLLVLALGLLVGRGVARVRGADPERRLVLAAVVGGCVAFFVSAGVDWVWQLPAVVAAFLVLGAIALGPAGGAAGTAGRSGRHRGRRLVLGGTAVAAIAAIGIPLFGTSELRQSQAQAAGAHLGPALARANTAGDVEPFAAGPPLQRALVLELAGRYADGAVAAAAATRSAPTDWRTWLVLSRLDAERGAAGPALAAFRRARALNPHSLVFHR